MPDFTERKKLREPGDSGDDAIGRREWLLEQRRLPDGTVPTGLIARASRQKRLMQRQIAARMVAEVRLSAAPPPIPPYWTPLGPSVIAHGQASGHPIVSGRITGLAVGPGGNRVYAATANGGVWYSEDAGAHWTPIDDPLSGHAGTLHLEADSLSTGGIAVRFGANAAADQIFVGTGETQAGYSGVGIKVFTPGNTPAWTLEAPGLATDANPGLAGAGIYKIIIDPAHPEIVFAATTRGLFVRPQAAPFDTWTLVAGGIPASTITDVVIGVAGIYFAAAQGGNIYRCANPTDVGGGTWAVVPGFAAAGRVILAASEGGGSHIVYALDQNGQLGRLDDPGAGSFVLVSGVPKALFFSGNSNQGSYDITLAVDPSNRDTVYVAGAALLADNEWTLPLFKGTIAISAGKYVFPFNPSNDMFPDSNGNNDSSHVQRDPTWIGTGVHPDGHAIVFATNADGTHDATNVWVGCDGGVFQSTQSGAKGSFQARNLGLAVTQINYVAQHPAADAIMVAGTQDQGLVRFRGDQVGFEDPEGDGGGCTYDPNNGYRIMRQYTHAALYTASDGGNNGDSSWTDLKAANKFPPIGSSATAAQKTAATTEDGVTGFYAPIAAVAVDDTHTLAAFGTNRLWITPDWGDSWVTLPSNNNPYAGGGVNAAQDVLAGGAVTAISWASPTRVYAATATSIYRFDQSGGNWTRTLLPGTNLPGGRIMSIAVEDATAGKIYVSLGGRNIDHVWYFDPGVGNWVSAGLAQATLDVPCHSIVVDPAHTDHIYLGCDVGVYQGVKTGAAAWSPWTPFSTNLPECAVYHVSIHPQTRMLRAATFGRGVWEIPLDAANVADPDVYLRANSADSGRVPRPSFLHGLPDTTHQGTTLDLLSSPDIKVLRSSRSQLDATPDFFGFASLRDFQTDLNTFDTLGTNQVLIEVHNRGKTAVPGAQVRVLLLLADGSASLPALPADFATRFQNGDTTSWLSAGWHFADPTNPYRTLPGSLDARTPQVVQYNVDFVSLNFTPDKIAAVAFVTTDGDPYTSTETNANNLVVSDKHFAVRVLEVGVDWRVVLGIVLVAVGIAAAIIV